jgi:membrane-associated progesterone receptor component
VTTSGSGREVKSIKPKSSDTCFTLEELRTFDGRNGKAIYIALQGIVFNVSSSVSFYGEGGAYAILAGRDASRALATMSLHENNVDNPTLEGVYLWYLVFNCVSYFNWYII